MGRGALVHLPVVIAPADIFPTAPCLGRISARDYGADQHDRLSLIWLTAVAEVRHAATGTSNGERVLSCSGPLPPGTALL